MDDSHQNLDQLSQLELKAEILRVRRIEQYLRAEVKALWEEINKFNKLPFINLYLKIFNKLSKIFPKTNSKTFYKINGESLKNTTSTSLKKIDYDFIFILPTNNTELGGVNVANSLAHELSKLDYKIGIITLQRDPSVAQNSLITQIESITTTKNIVACGAETIFYAQKLINRFKCNFYNLIQGPDFLFTPNWDDANYFINAVKEADLNICISPYLEKIALDLGGKNIKTFILGPDTNIFNFRNLTREKNVLVPCRQSSEKGLRYLLNSLASIRELGYKIIGFGDLENSKISNYFDDFMGRLNQHELSTLYNKSEFIIDPSLIEGLGLIALEAAHCGCIPLIQKRDSYINIFEKNKYPFIEVENFLDPTELKRAIFYAKTELSSEKVRDRVKDISFQNGFEKLKLEIL
jgi:hypothetical protein